MGTEENIGTLTDWNLEQGHGEALALITHDAEELTFGALHRLVCRFAARLADLGVRRGERVLMVMDNSSAFYAVFLGSIRLGAVPVPVNFLMRSTEFGFFLEDSYATLAVCDRPFREKVEPHAARLGVPLAVAGDPGAEHSVDSWLAEGPDHIDPVRSHRDDPAFWLYSSGSTGRPKAVVHLQRNVGFTCRTYGAEVLRLDATDRCFSTTPLFHAYGLGNALTLPMWVGASVVQLAGRPAPAAVLEKIERHRPTLLYSVPTLYNALLADPGLSGRDLSSLRLCVSAAEALPAEIGRRWQERTGTEILDGIGSTEMLHIYCSNRAGSVFPGSSGRPVTGYELELRDSGGDALAGDGEASGELWVKGGSMLAYYWHQHEKSKRSIQGEWFCSGDRYRRDADGVYWYEGRADDMMKVKGLWVSPIEIENRLIEHRRVREAAVVGVVREGLVRIKAFVILEAGATRGDSLVRELQEWCKSGLLRYQFPHEVEFVADLPRTATGKIQRFKLRQAP